MSDLRVLHVSDIHWGMSDEKGEQRRIVKGIVDAVRSNDRHADLCLFTGDLTQDGTQFEEAEKWLLELCQVATCPLFVVPGNHDVTRKDAKAELYGAAKDLDFFTIKRSEVVESATRFKAFVEWHQQAKPKLSLLSDWSGNLFGCGARLDVRGLTIRLLGLNSAILSHRKTDKGNLVVDIKTFNELLDSRQSENELVLAIGHHPTDWLADWNKAEIETLLKQETGPHAYLHGHLHVPKGTSEANNRGAALITLAAGAAYQGSEWEQSFAFYDFDLERREIKPTVYKYQHDTGKWLPDNAMSRPVSGRLPPCPARHSGEGAEGRPHGDSPFLTLRDLTDRLPDSSKGDGLGLYQSLPLGVPNLGIPPDQMVKLAEQGLIRSVTWETKSIITPLRTEIIHSGSVIFEPKAWTYEGELAPKRAIDEGILWVEIKPPPRSDLPLSAMRPDLQEIRNNDQVNESFVEFPRIKDKFAALAKNHLDRLFLGMPFCGKTSLLTYLGFRAAQDKDVAVIFLELKDLRAGTAEFHTENLLRALNDAGYFRSSRRLIFVIDNVHTEGAFEVARCLLTAKSRRWSVWAAARTKEFNEDFRPEKRSFWEPDAIDQIACSLIETNEIDFFVDEILSGALKESGVASKIEEIRSACKSFGQVPIRFLISAWDVVKRNEVPEGRTIADEIRRTPTHHEAVVSALWPNSRLGAAALVLADLLRSPSEGLLEAVLTKVEGDEVRLVKTALASLRRTLALLPDPRHRWRVSMYDPVRDEARKPENLTKSYEERAWEALKSILSADIAEDADGLDLSAYWFDLASHLNREKRSDVAILCVRRAVGLAPVSRETSTLCVSLLRELVGAVRARQEVCALAEAHPQSAWLAAAGGFAWGTEKPEDHAEAAKWFRRAVEVSPNERDIVSNYTVALSKSADVATVRRELEGLAAAHLQSAWLVAEVGLAWSGAKPEDYAEAAKWFRRAVEAAPNEREIVNNYAAVLGTSSDVATVRRELEGLADAYPRSAWLAAITGAAWGTVKPEDHAEASKWFRRAVEAASNERDIVSSYAAALTTSSDVATVRRELEGLADAYPQSAWLAATAGAAWGTVRPMDHAEAAKWLRRAVEAAPNERDIVGSYVAALRTSSDVATVRRELEGLADAHPQSAWLAAMAGAAWGTAKPEDHAEAAKWLRRAVKVSPDERDIVGSYAAALSRSADVATVRHELEGLADAYPQSAWLTLEVGFTWSGEKPEEHAEAAKWFRRAVEAAPNEREIVGNYAAALWTSSDVATARREFEGLADAYPRSAWLAATAGAAWGTIEPEDHVEAAKWFRRAVEAAPNERDIVGSYAAALSRSADVTTVRRELEGLADAHPQSAWLAVAAGAAWGTEKSEDYAKAVKWLRRAVEAAPNEREIVGNYAAALGTSSDVATVRRELEGLADAHPQSAWLAAEAGLAWGTEKPEDHAEAAKWFRRAVEVSPNERMAVGNYAAALSRSADSATVRRELEGLADAHSQSAWLAAAAGAAWSRAKPEDYAETAKWLRRAVEAAPNEREIISSYAAVLRTSSDVATVRRELEGLADAYPRSAWLAAMTGAAWATVTPEDHLEAAKWFRRAVEAASNERDIVGSYAAALKRSSDVATIRRELEGLADAHPQSAWLAAEAGLAWGTAKPEDHAEAAKWFRRAVETAPNEREIIGSYAAALKRSSDVATRRRELEGLADAYPRSAWLSAEAGLAWGTAKPEDHAEAAKWFRRAVDAAPNEREIVGNYAAALRTSWDVATHRRELEGLADAYPRSAWLAAEAGLAWATATPEDYEKATKLFRRAVEVAPNEREVAFNYAAALSRSSDVATVRRELEELADAHTQSAWLAVAAGAAWGTEKPEDCAEAVKWLRQAVKTAPNEREIVGHYAAALKMSSDVATVRRELEGLADAYPQSAWLAATAGAVWATEKPEDQRRAAEWYAKASTKKPDEEVFLIYLYGSLRKHEGEDKALDEVEILYRTLPLVAPVAETLGGLMVRKDPHRALPILERVPHESWTSKMLAIAGWANLGINRQDAAERHFHDLRISLSDESPPSLVRDAIELALGIGEGEIAKRLLESRIGLDQEPRWRLVDALLVVGVHCVFGDFEQASRHRKALESTQMELPGVKSGWACTELRTVARRVSDPRCAQVMLEAIDFFERTTGPQTAA